MCCCCCHYCYYRSGCCSRRCVGGGQQGVAFVAVPFAIVVAVGPSDIASVMLCVAIVLAIRFGIFGVGFDFVVVFCVVVVVCVGCVGRVPR